MNNTETGWPAFPSHGSMGEVVHDGLTLRQYAAIKLKVPDSGADWLDAMIVKSLRDDFAAKALANEYAQDSSSFKHVAEWTYQIADAMMEARK